MDKIIFKNIIFDWSGVVNDSLERHLRVVNKMFKSFGVSEIDLEELRENWEQPCLQFYRKYLPNITLEEEQVAYAKALSESGKCNSYPGMIELIKKLKGNGKNLIVISSDISDALISEVRDFGLDKTFSRIVTDAHDKTKELVKIIEKEKFNLDETVFIGDSNHEIESGKKVGIKTIAVTWGFTKKDRLFNLKPDFLVDSISELEECLL